jgi:predicted transcriptional regulator
MRITREMTIVGVPAIQLRDALRRLVSGFDAEYLANSLNMSAEEGRCITGQLLAEGYLEVEMEHHGRTYYHLTTKGAALQLASAAKPIKRATAERLVKEIIQRADAINAEPSYLYRVTKLLVFGSYLTDSPTLGDVDIAVELTPKIADPDEFSAAALKYTSDAAAAGKRFSSFFQGLFWPQEEIERTLKNSPYVSLHPTTDGVLKTAATRVIYEHK